MGYEAEIVWLNSMFAWPTPQSSDRMYVVLWQKGIGHNLDLWGADVNHDWPWWRKMLPYCLERLL